MNGVMILAHGSRVQSTKNTINEVVEMTKKKIGDIPLEIAYMEFCDENIEHGIKALTEKGVIHIKVVPYFLFEGIHIRQDIPEEIEKILKDYPGVTVEMGKTLGVDERLADILADRILN